MSPHHLQQREKTVLMKNVHKALTGSGIFLIWEPTLLDGETRAEWLDRFAGLRRAFAAIGVDEFRAMESHMRHADFPESADSRLAMGLQAGFGNAEEIFIMTNRMGGFSNIGTNFKRVERKPYSDYTEIRRSGVIVRGSFSSY